MNQIRKRIGMILCSLLICLCMSACTSDVEKYEEPETVAETAAEPTLEPETEAPTTVPETTTMAPTTTVPELTTVAPTTTVAETTTVAPTTTAAPTTQAATTTAAATTKAAETKKAVSRDGMIFKDIDSRTLTAKEVAKLSDANLRWAKNDLYALHHYIFTSSDAKKHYKNMEWYTGKYSSAATAEKEFSKTERKNLNTILNEIEEREKSESEETTTAKETTAESKEFISESKAKTAAYSYFDFEEGALDDDTGFLMALEVEKEPTTKDPRYVIALLEFEDDDHWEVYGRVDIDAYTGKATKHK